jgi:hypothetical protein
LSALFFNDFGAVFAASRPMGSSQADECPSPIGAASIIVIGNVL